MLSLLSYFLLAVGVLINLGVFSY